MKIIGTKIPKGFVKELLKHVRGNLSQSDLSSKLGYEYNIAYRWESEKLKPTWEQFIQILRLNLPDSIELLAKSLNLTPKKLHSVPHFIAHFKAIHDASDFHEVFPYTESQVKRWLHGSKELWLNDALVFMASSSSYLFYVMMTYLSLPRESIFKFFPETKTSLNQTKVRTRTTLQAITLGILDLDEYRNAKKHIPGFLADAIGISIVEENQIFAELEATGVLIMKNGKWHGTNAAGPTLHLHTRDETLRKLLLFYANRIIEFLQDENYYKCKDDDFFVRTGGISNESYEKMKATQRRSIDRLAHIAAQPQKKEVIAAFGGFALRIAPRTKRQP